MELDNPSNIAPQQTQDNATNFAPQQAPTVLMGPEPQQMPTMPQAEKKPSKMPLIILGSVVVLLLLIIIACVVFFMTNRKAPDSTETGNKEGITEVSSPKESTGVDEEIPEAETSNPQESISADEAIAQTEAKFPMLKISETKEKPSEEYGVYCQPLTLMLEGSGTYYVYAKTSAACAQVGAAVNYIDQLATSEVNAEQLELRNALQYYSIYLQDYQSNNGNKTPFAGLQAGYVFSEKDKFISRYIAGKYEKVTLQYLGSSDSLNGKSVISANQYAPTSATNADNKIYAISKATCASTDGEFELVDKENEVAMFILLGDGMIDCRNN